MRQQFLRTLFATTVLVVVTSMNLRVADDNKDGVLTMKDIGNFIKLKEDLDSGSFMSKIAFNLQSDLKVVNSAKHSVHAHTEEVQNSNPFEGVKHSFSIASSSPFSCESLPAAYDPHLFCSGVVDYGFVVWAGTNASDLDLQARGIAANFNQFINSPCLSDVKRLICSNIYLQCVPDGKSFTCAHLFALADHVI